MAKKISIVVMIVALILGIVAIYSKTRETYIEKPDVEAIQEAVVGNPKDSFGEVAKVSTPTATPSIVSTDRPQDGKGPYPMDIDIKKTYEAVLKTTAGDMTILLTAKETPITVNNFIALSKKGFYDNTIFHRVIKGFMIQGGDPKGDGTGNPGYTFDDEPFTGEYTRGTIAMANSGPNTNGSQFFIMHADYGLPKNYVIFGHVTKGIEVVDAIAESPTIPGGEGSKPVTPTKVISIQIIER